MLGPCAATTLREVGMRWNSGPLGAGMRGHAMFDFNPSAPVLAVALLWNFVCAVLLGRAFGTTSHRELYAYSALSLFVVNLSVLPMISLVFFLGGFLVLLLPYWAMFAAGPVA